jgi:hypothetical protein
MDALANLRAEIQRWERAVEKADEEFTVRAARLLKWI